MDERLANFGFEDQMSTYGHHGGVSMNSDTEPVCRVDLSLFEAQALYNDIVFMAGRVSKDLEKIVSLGTLDEARALLSGEKTRSRSIAKLKSSIDDALIECKRRFARPAKTE